MTPLLRRPDPSAALLLAPAAVGLALAAACSRPSDPLVPYVGPATVCGREADTKVCDEGWAFECSYDPAEGRCAWRTLGEPCAGEPGARGVVVAGGACGRTLVGK
ncbi:MAG TPA: hypothetical protein VFS43_46750 [Polyangiaceae bacterium]|nr:hypothetical protein [Polyangiaceae bacterium]